MKKRDLHKGQLIAVVKGEGIGDRVPQQAKCAEVVELGVERQWSRRQDGVRVRLVDDPLNQNWSSYRNGDMPPATDEDGTFVVSTKRCWCAWSEAKPRIEAHLAKIENQEIASRHRNERVVAIEDAMRERGVGLADHGIHWPYVVRDEVTVPVAALEQLLELDDASLKNGDPA